MLVAEMSRCVLNVTARIRPYLLSSKAGAGADSTQVLLLPLVSYLVSFSIIIAHRIIWVSCKRRISSTANLEKKDGGADQVLRGSHLNSPLPFPKQVQLIN